MTASLSTVVGKDGNAATIVGGVQALDKSGAGTGPWVFAHVIADGVAGTNLATVKPANTAAVAADPAMVVALSPNGLNTNGIKSPANSAPVVMAGYTYKTVAASQTGQALGTGAVGDYLEGIVIIPGTTSPGNVIILDNAVTVYTFTGGASSVSNLCSFNVPVKSLSVSGAWKITTGANVTVLAIGNFTP